MDTSEPIVTIKITTDNAELLQYIFHLIVVTLIVLNINLVFSIVDNMSKLVFRKVNRNAFLVQSQHYGYTPLENESS